MNPRRDMKPSHDGAHDDTTPEAQEPLSASAAPHLSGHVPDHVSGHMTDQIAEPELKSHQLQTQRRFMAEHTTCAMCDTKLEIRHEINMADLKVKEEAHCPSCGIRVRSSHHLMH